MAGISLEDQINAIHRSQGLLDDESSAANRIGPSIPKPTSTSSYSSSAKTIQKPAQLSAKSMVTIAAAPQRTIVAPPMMPRTGLQPVTMLAQPTHAMMAMPPIMAVSQPGVGMHQQPPMDEPSAKRQKTEDQLMPEDDFYKTFGKVNIRCFWSSFSCLCCSSFRVRLQSQCNCLLYQRNPNGISMVKRFHWHYPLLIRYVRFPFRLRIVIFIVSVSSRFRSSKRS